MAQATTVGLPADYGDAAAEYIALREGVGLADRSYRGRVRISGADALDLLNRLTTNELETLPLGEGAPTVLTSPKGRVVDLLLVGARPDYFVLLTSPGRQEAVMEWIDFYTFADDAPLQDITPLTRQFTVVGPGAAAALSAAGALAGQLPQYHLRGATFGSAPAVVWRTMDPGPESYEVIVASEGAADAWRTLVEAGAVPVGGTAWEAFRIAQGTPAYGAEYGEETNPLESRLRGAISFDKGCYTGQEVVARLDTYQKVQRRLMALSLSGPAKRGDALVDDGRKTGVLTSVAAVPTDRSYVALALVSVAQGVAGHTLAVEGSAVTATLADPAYALATEPAGT